MGQNAGWAAKVEARGRLKGGENVPSGELFLPGFHPPHLHYVPPRPPNATSPPDRPERPKSDDFWRLMGDFRSGHKICKPRFPRRFERGNSSPIWWIRGGSHLELVLKAKKWL